MADSSMYVTFLPLQITFIHSERRFIMDAKQVKIVLILQCHPPQLDASQLWLTRHCQLFHFCTCIPHSFMSLVRGRYPLEQQLRALSYVTNTAGY